MHCPTKSLSHIGTFKNDSAGTLMPRTHPAVKLSRKSLLGISEGPMLHIDIMHWHFHMRDSIRHRWAGLTYKKNPVVFLLYSKRCPGVLQPGFDIHTDHSNIPFLFWSSLFHARYVTNYFTESTALDRQTKYVHVHMFPHNR